MKLSGANRAAKVVGLEELPGKSNYFIGNDPKKWRTNVPNYAKVRYRDVYPGIDLVYYGNQGQLEYDFVVAPGADPKAIKLAVGAVREPPDQPLRIDGSGDLVIQADGGEVRFRKPVVYQPAEALDESRGSQGRDPLRPRPAPRSEPQQREFLNSHYVLEANNQISFEIASYDPTKPLVIDPVLSYSTYFSDCGISSIAVDAFGNAYLTGGTASTDFPTTTGAWDTTCGTNGNCNPGTNGPQGDAFVTKLNPTGTALVYSTFLGGSDIDWGAAIALDTSGDAYVAGSTHSLDFPTKSPFQATCSSCTYYSDGFVTKLNPTGSALVYSSYLGGFNEDYPNAIAVDGLGNAYVAGSTRSLDFPLQNPFQTYCVYCVEESFSGFVSKINPTGSALVYSTYLGGSTPEPGANDYGDSVQAIAVDPWGHAYVTGSTFSTNFPTANAFQGNTSSPGWEEAYVTKFDSGGSTLVYSTYLGGNHDDFGIGITTDRSGSAYVVGMTASTNFPTTASAFQGSCNQCGYFPTNECDPESYDVFVAKFDPTGSALEYSTYLGGSDQDFAAAIAVDASGDTYVTGSTYSTDFPIKRPLQAHNAGLEDAFLAKLDASGSALIYSTYLGGSQYDQVYAIALDRQRNAYLTGGTLSPDFPLVNPFQAQLNGGANFILKIAPIPLLRAFPTRLLFAPQQVGTRSLPREVTLSSVGEGPVTLGSISASGDFAEMNTCPRSLDLGQQCTVFVTFTPKAFGVRAGELTIRDNAQRGTTTVELAGVGL